MRMSAEQWQKELNACVIQTEFMCKLAKEYSSNDMSRLWDALGEMNRRYGRVFTAEAIKKDRSGAELALFRYGKKHRQKTPDYIPVKGRKS